MTTIRRPRVRAPELAGAGGWLNTGGAAVSLADLRGKIVLLDFWTFCCINCLHVLEELRPVEERHRDVLVVVGVHSPKFPHEADHEALVAAVERYEVGHPVLDDPELRTWQQYAVRAWPTLVVIDPEGYVVAVAAGEGHAEALGRLIEELVTEHDARGTLRRGDGPYVPPPPATTTFRYPGKVVWWSAGTAPGPPAPAGAASVGAGSIGSGSVGSGSVGSGPVGSGPALVGAGSVGGGSLFVSDSGNHSIVELGADGEAVLRRIGSGRRGRRDGVPTEAEFAEPQGLALLPPAVAAEVGYQLVVADTANHLLRGIRLEDGAVTTVADLPAALAGVQVVTGGIPPVPSPWDVAWWHDRLVVAAAGVHLLLEFDPRTGRVGVLAGTTVEGLRDGPALDGWLAQPSGLATASDGAASDGAASDGAASDGAASGAGRLWIADAESSALRWLDEVDGVVTLHTAVGAGLFDFGHVDGPAGAARFQHPLGVAVLPDGSVAVLDTYNGAVRRYDPDRDEVTTLATDLAEPSGAVVVDGELVVVESAAHRVGRPVAPGELRRINTPAPRSQRPPAEIAPGPVTLDVIFEPGPGQRLDDRSGPATLLQVSASPPELLGSGAGDSVELRRSLQVSAAVTEGVLHVTAQAASCDAVAEHPACHVTRQDWGVPVRVVPGGPDRLVLMLRGMPA